MIIISENSYLNEKEVGIGSPALRNTQHVKIDNKNLYSYGL